MRHLKGLEGCHFKSNNVQANNSARIKQISFQKLLRTKVSSDFSLITSNKSIEIMFEYCSSKLVMKNGYPWNGRYIVWGENGDRKLERFYENGIN